MFKILLLGLYNFQEELENIETIGYKFLKFHYLLKNSIIKKLGLDLNL